jgi:hypothetical protein
VCSALFSHHAWQVVGASTVLWQTRPWREQSNAASAPTALPGAAATMSLQAGRKARRRISEGPTRRWPAAATGERRKRRPRCCSRSGRRKQPWIAGACVTEVPSSNRSRECSDEGGRMHLNAIYLCVPTRFFLKRVLETLVVLWDEE